MFVKMCSGWREIENTDVIHIINVCLQYAVISGSYTIQELEDFLSQFWRFWTKFWQFSSEFWGLWLVFFGFCSRTFGHCTYLNNDHRKLHPIPETWLSSPVFHEGSKNETLHYPFREALATYPRQYMGPHAAAIAHALPRVGGRCPCEVPCEMERYILRILTKILTTELIFRYGGV